MRLVRWFSRVRRPHPGSPRRGPGHGTSPMKERLVAVLLAGGLTMALLPAPSAAHHEGTDGFVGADDLIHLVDDATASVRTKLDALKALGGLDSVTVAELFEMQRLMDHLSSLSDMSTRIMAEANEAISRIARSVKS
jgi:hypothetical protein